VDSPTRSLTLSPGIAFKPMSSMFVQLSPTFNRYQDAAQYVTTVPDSTDVAFFGNRYVFAYIKARTISLDTRINWTFSPNLTLQLFVQPFIRECCVLEFQRVRGAEEREEAGVWRGYWDDRAGACEPDSRSVVHGGSGWGCAGGAFFFSGS
jgi:hypothetical protein